MLSRRWLINFGLLTLIIVFTYIGNRYDVETGFNPVNRITTLNAADIDSVSIKTADESLDLQRISGSWHITSPIRWPANNINVERMLSITQVETESRLPVAEIDLSIVGLQFPRVMLQLNDTSILFGGTNNVGNRRYAMIDATVYLLPDLHLPFISQGLLGIVDRRLLPASEKLQSLKLPEYELTRSDNGAWRIVDSEQFSSDKLNNLVGNWQRLQASRVRIYQGGSTPRQKVIARLGDGRLHEFYVISISPEIIIAHPQIGLQYHFNESYYYQLLSLRDDENTEY